MPSHRAPKLSPRKTSAFALAGVAAGSVLLTQGSAHAETVAQAKADYNQKLNQGEAAAEAYDSANAKVADLQQKINTLQAQISSDTAGMVSFKRAMGMQAAQQYMDGGVSDSLKLALESSPETYLNQALTNNEVATKEALVLKTLAADKAQIAADQKLAANELSQQQAQAATAKTAKDNADAAAAQAKQIFNSLTAAQQAALQASEAGPAPSQVNINVSAPNARAAEAVAYAESKLGDYYVYAAAGPSTFDCSGLTMEAWAQAGVALPHNAAEQYDMTEHISESQAMPGDLVFFDLGEGGISHVGVYVGNSMMIDATHTGSTIMYNNINDFGAVAIYFGRVQ